MSATVIEADCLEAMREMEDASVDSVVCDPPYGLEFMGKTWDGSDGFRRSLNPADAERDDPFGRASRTSPEYRAGKVFQAWCEAWAVEALRVLKPGGHLLAFGGTRTYHRLACAIEDAGFEIRDCLAWLYGSGFPKSLDVSKAIDKAAGAEREVQEVAGGGVPPGAGNYGGGANQGERYRGVHWADASTTPEAQQWDGWGTALKPAHEPIVVARKPLAGTVAANVLEHGTGALNVDGCRVEGPPRTTHANGHRSTGSGEGYGLDAYEAAVPSGRWPANVVLSHAEGCELVGTRTVRAITGGTGNHDGSVYGARSNQGDSVHDYADADGMEVVEAWRCAPGCPVAELDRQSGELRSGQPGVHRSGVNTSTAFGAEYRGGEPMMGYGDAGGASRFFYIAKASRAERDAGLEGFPERPWGQSSGAQHAIARGEDAYQEGEGTLGLNHVSQARNTHPTVKPVELMRWLVRMVTPPGGTVLDPFAGSGTTGCAAALEGVRFVGVEREAEYVAIARARIAWWSEHPEGMQLTARLAADERRRKVVDSGQLGLLD